MGNQNYGIDPERLDQYALEILETKKLGIELAIVIGGGNIYRGVQAEHAGIDRAQGDYMGMLATMINAMALQSALEKYGAEGSGKNLPFSSLSDDLKKKDKKS